MKKTNSFGTAFFALIAATFALGFLSCGDSDKPEEPTTPKTRYLPSKIVASSIPLEGEKEVADTEYTFEYNDKNQLISSTIFSEGIGEAFSYSNNIKITYSDDGRIATSSQLVKVGEGQESRNTAYTYNDAEETVIVEGGEKLSTYFINKEGYRTSHNSSAAIYGTYLYDQFYNLKEQRLADIMYNGDTKQELTNFKNFTHSTKYSPYNALNIPAWFIQSSFTLYPFNESVGTHLAELSEIMTKQITKDKDGVVMYTSGSYQKLINSTKEEKDNYPTLVETSSIAKETNKVLSKAQYSIEYKIVIEE